MEKKDFKLDKIKYLKEKVTIDYHQVIMVDNTPKVITQSPISPIQPSEPFKVALNALRQRLVEIFFSKDMRDQLIHKVLVHGFMVTGDEDQKIKIFGKIECMAGYTVSLNTPWILLDGEERYGNERDLMNNVKELHDRAYAYVFEGEKSQFDIPFDNSKEEDQSEPSQEAFDNTIENESENDNPDD